MNEFLDYKNHVSFMEVIDSSNFSENYQKYGFLIKYLVLRSG